MEATTTIEVNNPPQDIKGLIESFSDIANRIRNKYPGIITQLTISVKYGNTWIKEYDEVKQ